MGLNFSLDSKIVFDIFNDVRNTNNDFGSIIMHCRQLLSTCFHNSHVGFSWRQANMVAYELAQTTLLEASPQLFDDVPPYIFDLLLGNKM